MFALTQQAKQSNSIQFNSIQWCDQQANQSREYPVSQQSINQSAVLNNLCGSF
jgi:hypothetical protein